MTKFTTTLLLAAGFAAAQDQPTKTATQPGEVTIPANAVMTDDGSFRAVDKKGKAWIYRKTPFGVSKTEEKAIPAPEPPLEDTVTKATVSGDTVHFEKPTPFGVTKWDKKTADLNANEQRILARQKTKQ